MFGNDFGSKIGGLIRRRPRPGETPMPTTNPALALQDSGLGMPLYKPGLPIGQLPQISGDLGLPQYGQQFSGADMFRLMQQQLAGGGYGLYGFPGLSNIGIQPTPPREQST